MKKGFLKAAIATLAVSFTAGVGTMLVNNYNEEELPSASAAATTILVNPCETSADAYGIDTSSNTLTGVQSTTGVTCGGYSIEITSTTAWYNVMIPVGSLTLADLQKYDSLSFDAYSTAAHNWHIVGTVIANGVANKALQVSFPISTLTANSGAFITGDGINYIQFVVQGAASTPVYVDNVCLTGTFQTSTPAENVLQSFETLQLSGVNVVSTSVSTAYATEGNYSNALINSDQWFEIHVPLSSADLTPFKSISFDYAFARGGEPSLYYGDKHHDQGTISGTHTIAIATVNDLVKDGVFVITGVSSYANDVFYIDNFRGTYNTYTVSATAETGGTAKTSATSATHGSTVTLTATPNTGYNFAGWYLDGTKVSSSATYKPTITANSAYTAKFTKKTYAVTLTAGTGGTVSGAGTYEHGASATIKATADTGYTFTKWSDGDTNASRTLTVTAAVDLTATFTINTYTVTFNVNGGTGSFAAQTVEYNAYAKNPGSPTKTGYTFKRWSTTTTGSAFTFNSTPITKNITLYAVWQANEYTLTFKANGGNWSGSTADVTITQDYKTDITAPANPTRTGYNFAGWDKTIPASIPAEDMTFTAKWTIKSYTVSFDVNGGTGSFDAQTVEYNAYAKNPGSPTRTGYTFKRWSTTTTGSAFTFNSTPITKTMTLYAVWEINQYTVTFNTNGGSAVASQTVEYNAKATKPSDPTKTGYTFAGWDFDFNTAITSNKTINASWTINKYTVTFNTNGGSAVASQTVEHGKAATKPSNPTKTGYTFAGWDYNFTDAITSNKTINASWTINTYKVTLTAGTGGTVSGAGTYDHGSKATITATPNAGYVFVKWSDGDTNASREITVTSAVDLSAEFKLNVFDVTLTASTGGTVSGAGTYEYGETATIVATADAGYSFTKWSDGDTNATRQITVTEAVELSATFTINTYTVSFDTKGGNAVAAKTAVHNTTITAPSDPTKTGYTFQHWSVEEDGEAYDFATAVTSDFTLYAVWTVNGYTLTVVSENESYGTVTGSGAFDYNAQATVVATANAGYVFEGWYVGSTKESSDATYTFQVTADTTLTAKFTRKQITNTFLNVDGSDFATTQSNASIGSEADMQASNILPANKPLKGGYTFIGWADATTGELISSNTMICNDAPKTYYATYVSAYSNSITTTDMVALNFYLRYLAYSADVNLVAQFDEYDEAGAVVETVCQSSADVKDVTVEDATCYKFFYAQAPKDYINRVRIRILVGGVDYFVPVNANNDEVWEDYSIANHLMDLKDRATSLEDAGETEEATLLRNLAVDMELFCEMARQYFDSNYTESEVGFAEWDAFDKLADLSAAQMQGVTPIGIKEGSEPASIRLVGVTPVLTFGTELRLNFQVRDGAGFATEIPANIQVTLADGSAATVVKRTSASANGTTYFYVSIKDIAASNLANEQLVTITDTTTGESVTVTMSGIGYAYSSVAEYEAAAANGTASIEQTKRANLCKAMYYYCQSAAAYFA